MGKPLVIFLSIVLLAMTATAYAELQNVEVGGELIIRGRYYDNVVGRSMPAILGQGQPGALPAEGPFFRHPVLVDPILGNGLAAITGKRPLGPFGLTSIVTWDDRGEGLKLVDQRTRLHVKADFTDNVTAFIEFDSTDIWGQDFRSNHITGVDIRANSADDVEVFQSYIEANEMFGQPLRVRIGRQAMTFGKGFLVSEKWSPVAGLSFDGIRATYGQDKFTVDAWWTKLAERSPVEEDGDVDFYGVYATYAVCDELSVSGYWMLVRDGIKRFDTQLGWLGEAIEDFFGLDDYDPTMLHTIGLRLWGKAGAFDYDMDVAYQFGEADAVGVWFNTNNFWGLYGDDGADFGNLGIEGEAGYTFDVNWQPRVYLGLRYFQGEDNRDISFWDWVNPFYKPEASVSFNRMFAECNVCPVTFDNNHGSNYYEIKGGVMVKPTEKVSAKLELEYYAADEPFDMPLHWNIGRYNVVRPVSVLFPFVTDESDSELAWVANLWVFYRYTKDVMFLFLYQHQFTQDGLVDGNFTRQNALDMSAGTNDDDAALWCFVTSVKF